MKKLITLFTSLIFLVCFFPAYAQDSNNATSTSSMTTDNGNAKQMSDVMTKMKDIKMKHMGRQMMMMGVKMKMMGEYMSKSSDADMTAKGTHLIKLGEQVFATGKELAGKPAVSKMMMKKGPTIKGQLKRNNADMDMHEMDD